jgi:hypothetical protein
MGITKVDKWTVDLLLLLPHPHHRAVLVCLLTLDHDRDHGLVPTLIHLDHAPVLVLVQEVVHRPLVLVGIEIVRAVTVETNGMINLKRNGQEMRMVMGGKKLRGKRRKCNGVT